MVLNFTNICRLCLTKGRNEAMLPLFIEDQTEENNLSLSVKVMTLTTIEKMFSGDGLPSRVCRQCVHKVTTSYEFKLLCEQSDTKLRGYIRNSINILAPQFPEDLRVKEENCVEEWKSASESCTSATNMHHNSSSQTFSQGDIDASCVENTQLNSGTKSSMPSSKKNVAQLSLSGKDSVHDNSNDYFNTEASEIKTEAMEMVELVIGQNESNYVSDEDRNTSILNVEMGLNGESRLKPLIYVDVEDGITKPITQVSTKVNKNICIKSLNYSAKYRCSFCKKPFVNKAHLTQHLMTHTGERPFVCHVCGIEFARYSNLTRHSLRHAREESRELKRGRHKSEVAGYECAICLKIFKKKPYLVEHLMCHTGEKPFKCEICGVGFRRHSNLVRHIKSHSENDYLTGQHLQRGRRRSKENITQYDCDVCSKSFKVGSHLKTHMMTHTGEKSFMCDMCGQFFARRTNMVRHARLHTEGSYQAAGIPRRGRRKNNLSFECHICSKPFQHMSRWREHVMSHTGEKPHMCDVCGKFFARRTNLIRHSKVHIDVMTSA